MAAGCFLLVLLLLGKPTEGADSPAPAEILLRLVPPDATLVVTVENLRDQIRTIDQSRLIADLRNLPVVRSWLDSEKARDLKRSCDQIETVLGVKLADLRDDLLGDAVVLVLRLDPEAPIDPSQARGLLLLRARDPALLERLIARVNESQRAGGELERVDDRRRGGTTYHVREFPAGSGRPPEFFVSDPDGTFAFSNSEAMIQGVIDRKSGNRAGVGAGPGLGDLPRVAAVRRRLPERALARLYVDPRAVERWLAMAFHPGRTADARLRALVERYVAAVEYAGAALIWRPDAIVVEAVETLDPSRVDGWLRHWAGDTRPFRPEMRRVPGSALALASMHIDLTAIREAVYQVVPEDHHQRLRNLETVLSGLLLGQDFSSRIVPSLGPGVIAYVDSPAEGAEEGQAPPSPLGRGGLFPVVVVVDLARDQAQSTPDAGRRGASAVAISDALDNGLRTLLALPGAGRETRPGASGDLDDRGGGRSVRTLSAPLPFAYAVDGRGGRLVLGTSARSVSRYLDGTSDPESGARFRDLQAATFPGYATFACVDLDAMTRLADRFRDRLAKTLAARQNRPTKEVEGDLEHVLALARLFRAAYVASRIEPDATAVQRSFGLILHGSAVSGPAAP